MNDVTACSPWYRFTFSPRSILMPHGKGLRGEEEWSDPGKVCKLATFYVSLKSLFTQNLPAE